MDGYNENFGFDESYTKASGVTKAVDGGLVRANALAMLGYLIYNVVLLACYLLEVIKGSRTIQYYIVFAILAILPLAIMYALYRKNRSSKYIKSVMAIGYAFFYNYTIFTTVSPVAFVYGILVSLLIIIYAEVRISLLSGLGMLIFNIVYVAYAGMNGDITKEMLPDVEIRIGFTALYAFFMVMVTKALIKNNQEKLSEVASEKEHVSGMLGHTMNISDSMKRNITMVSEKMDALKESVDKTVVSMTEVSNGTSDTAESVQTQLIKTEEIQNVIRKVENVTDTINGDMVEADGAVNTGKQRIEELISQVEVSERAGNKVAAEMDKLSSYASQMQNIVEIIDNITSQTSLLALNASIEAARVGEAGKGFAVVASEITNLADQTQSATVDIAELIGNLSEELNEVVNVIGELVENTKVQSRAAAVTATSFEAIAGMTEDIKAQADELTGLVSELASSNEEIVDSIQTISAATEEVTAHSNETLDCSEENTIIVGEVSSIVDELEKLAEELNEVEQ